MRHAGSFKVQRFVPDEGEPLTNLMGLREEKGRWETVEQGEYKGEINARGRATLEAVRHSLLCRVWDEEGEEPIYQVDRRTSAATKLETRASER